MRRFLVCTAVASLLAGCAAPTYGILPVAIGGHEIRYDRGTPTMYSEGMRGAIQITPLGTQADQKLVFGIAAYNKGQEPANLGTENVLVVTDDGAPMKVFTTEELVSDARTKAMWAQIGVALAGAAAAYAANQAANRTYNSTLVTPRGVYTYSATYRDTGAAIAGTALAGAATGVGIVSIRNALDERIVDLRGTGLQTTTVDPEQSYGGEIVVSSVPNSQYPCGVVVTVTFNGEPHVFHFTVIRQG